MQPLSTTLISGLDGDPTFNFLSKYFFSRYLYIRSFGNNVSFRMGFPRRRSPSFVSAPPPSVLAAPTPFLCGPFLTAEGRGWMLEAQYAGKFPSERAPYSLSFFFYLPPQFFHLLLLPLSPSSSSPPPFVAISSPSSPSCSSLSER